MFERGQSATTQFVFNKRCTRRLFPKPIDSPLNFWTLLFGLPLIDELLQINNYRLLLFDETLRCPSLHLSSDYKDHRLFYSYAQ